MDILCRMVCEDSAIVLHLITPKIVKQAYDATAPNCGLREIVSQMLADLLLHSKHSPEFKYPDDISFKDYQHILYGMSDLMKDVLEHIRFTRGEPVFLEQVEVQDCTFHDHQHSTEEDDCYAEWTSHD